MPTVADFFATKSHKKVAARLGNNNNKLYYCELDAVGPVRPSVYLQDYLKREGIQFKGKVMVNYDTNAWINKNSPLEVAFDSLGPISPSHDGKPQRITMGLSMWEQFNLDKLGPKPGLNSLFDSTLSLSESKSRRIYMLGTFCLLKKAGLIYRTKNMGHNIGAMLVSKQGQVLSWGVNTGEFRHAEVNTIINYFRLNPRETNLPVDSVLFSTLKPCLMCSTLIKEAWRGGKTRVWYGMMDEGGSGSSPLLGPMSSEFTSAEVELDVWELLSDSGTLDSATKTTGTKPVQVTHKGNKVDLYQTLTGSGGNSRGMSAADWVDYSDDVLDLIEAAVQKFEGKANKVRDDGAVKKVLLHLKDFVK